MQLLNILDIFPLNRFHFICQHGKKYYQEYKTKKLKKLKTN